MKRWRAGAATVLATTTVLATSGPAMASSTSWSRVLQVNRAGSFTQIAAISKASVWAVGDLWDSQGNAIYRPLIRHYAGGEGWSTVTIPGAPRFSSDQVTASSPKDVWVVGLMPGTVAHSMAYRFDGSRWHKIPVPAKTYLQGTLALGPDNVWAFGSSATIFAPGSSVSASVFHWNGARWRGYNLANGNLMPESISASGTRDVWIAGSVWAHSAYQAEAFRWNGSAWHNAGLPRVLTDEPGVSAISPANVWLGWNTATASHSLHWNGHRWLPQSVPDNVNADTSNVVPDGQGGYWFGGFAILAGGAWTSVPWIGVTGGAGPVYRIPGTESFLQPATVKNSGSAIQRPTIYRYDL